MDDELGAFGPCHPDLKHSPGCIGSNQLNIVRSSNSNTRTGFRYAWSMSWSSTADAASGWVRRNVAAASASFSGSVGAARRQHHHCKGERGGRLEHEELTDRRDAPVPTYERKLEVPDATRRKAPTSRRPTCTRRAPATRGGGVHLSSGARVSGAGGAGTCESYDLTGRLCARSDSTLSIRQQRGVRGGQLRVGAPAVGFSASSAGSS